MSTNEHVARFSDLLEDGAGNDADKRVDELNKRFSKLMDWGIVGKLPASQKTLRETLAETQARLAAWKEGAKDSTQVVAMTNDVARLEKWAMELDKTFVAPNAPATKFDIETATTALDAAKSIDERAKTVVDTVKDAAKETGTTIVDGAKKVPSVVYLGVAAVGVGLLLHEINKVRSVARAKR